MSANKPFLQFTEIPFSLFFFFFFFFFFAFKHFLQKYEIPGAGIYDWPSPSKAG